MLNENKKIKWIFSKSMELMEIAVPALIISAVGIMVGTRIWIMFRKWLKSNDIKLPLCCFRKISKI